MEDFKRELQKRLAQYQLHEGHGRPFDHVIFFAEKDGDRVLHSLCYGSQIPGVDAFCKEYKPFFLIVQPVGPVVYEYRSETND